MGLTAGAKFYLDSAASQREAQGVSQTRDVWPAIKYQEVISAFGKCIYYWIGREGLHLTLSKEELQQKPYAFYELRSPPGCHEMQTDTNGQRCSGEAML